MKILLTLDLDQPASPERQGSENILRLLWDQLQVTGASLDLLCLLGKPINQETNSLAQWATAASCLKNAEKYRTLAPSPLETYDLVIAANPSPASESFFNSLGIRTLIVRNIPCEGFDSYLLARANFSLPEHYCQQLPSLKNLYYQEIPLTDVSKDDRHWWLANRFLINKENTDPSTLIIGTTVCQTERIENGRLINLHHYMDELMALLGTCPNLYYCARQPMDHSELRVIKLLNVSCPSMSIPQLLSRDEFDSVISIDSGLVPLAKAFNKPIKILGDRPTWSVLKTRLFRDSNFITSIATKTP